MEAAQTLEAKPGQNTAQFDDEHLHKPMQPHLEALSKAAGQKIDQTPSKPGKDQDIDLEQLKSLGSQPIQTEGGTEGFKEQWDTIFGGKTSRMDKSKNFGINWFGRRAKQEERKLKGEDSGSNDNG